MKKYIISLIALTILAVIMPACEDNIKVDEFHETTQFTQEQLMKNNSYVQGFIDNAYNYLPVGYNRDNGALLAVACDEAMNSYLDAASNIVNLGTWSPMRTFDESYVSNYEGLRKVNVFLSKISYGLVIPINDKINADSARTRMRGEAFFLRAFFHFELVKRYGGVVLANRVFDRYEDLNFKQNTFDECVASMVQDLDSAIARLPLSNKELAGSADSREVGRATVLAAMALKARILLYAASPLHNPENNLNKWQAAADVAQAVMELEAQKKVALFRNYPDIFDYTTAPYNDEVIFATKADNINSVEQNNAPISYDGALGRTNPTQELVDAFEMAATGRLISDPLSGYDENNPYTGRDPRFGMNIFYDGSNYKNIPVETFVGGKDGIGQNVNATKTGYYMRKFVSQDARWNSTSNATRRRPWILIRYAEVLLNYAEALNEAQGIAAVDQVLAAVNQVRNRNGVKMPALQITDPAGNAYVEPEQAAIRERIKNERRVELCFEEHRFFDIRRWKEGDKYLNKPVHGMRIVLNENTLLPVYEKFEVQKRIFDDKQYFYPFPQQQRFLQPDLNQNPGWE